MDSQNCDTKQIDELEVGGNCDTPAAVASAPKKSKRGLIIGISIAVAIAMAITLVAILANVGLLLGGASKSKGKNKDNSSATTTASEPGTSEPGTSDPDATYPDTTDPSASTPSKPDPTPSAPVDVELVINQAELTYEMTDEDVELYYSLLEECKTTALSGGSKNAVMDLSDAIDDQYAYMDTQLTIATVLYYCDLKDEDASQLYLDCTEILTKASDAYMEMAKELYAAEFPAKERFFEEWTEQDLAMLQSYTSEIMELRQRNSEIIVAYQDLQDDSNMYTKMVPLYIEMVQNNNRMAQIYGYNNYYEYAYEMEYDRDYGADEVSAMRSLVAEYLPYAIEGAMDAFYDNLENLSYMQQYTLSGFLYDPFENGYTDELEEYLATLPESAREAMLDMFDGNIIICDEYSNAQEGAFTTNISDDRCMCFFGPGYSSVLTAIHEVGHYYGGAYTDLDDIPLDLAEVQSQGNEWLFMSFMEDNMNKKLYDTVVNYQLYENMAIIMISLIVDEFEERVYTHPDIANLTSDDLDAIMEQVCLKYGGVDYLSEIAADVQNYWRMVVVEQPVYYISYGVSAIAAIDIYTIADEDYEQAVQIYCALIENVDLDEGFLGNLQDAELAGPFDDDVYLRLYEMYS